MLDLADIEVATHYGSVPKFIFCFVQEVLLAFVVAVPWYIYVFIRTRFLSFFRLLQTNTLSSSDLLPNWLNQVYRGNGFVGLWELQLPPLALRHVACEGSVA